MRDINYKLKAMCKDVKHGSYISRSNRWNILQKSANQLNDLGYKLGSPNSLKPKHVDALLMKWKEEGLSNGTLRNRFIHLRWWAREVGKISIIKKTNAEYGIGARENKHTPRAFCLSGEMLDKISNERVRLALRLQEAFGLRKEEALKFRPSIAVMGNKIALKASWTKGGRAREIPITSEYQRELLDAVQALARSGSLIPDNKNYVQFVNTYYNEAKKAGITNPHGLRHQYAQRRYTEIAKGMQPPACGGLKKSEMTEQQTELDRLARLQVSKELGHNRLEVTNVYLGGAH